MHDETLGHQPAIPTSNLSPERNGNESEKVIVVSSLDEATAMLNKIAQEKQILIRGIISSQAEPIDLSVTNTKSDVGGLFASVRFADDVPVGEQRRKVVDNIQTIVRRGSELTPGADGTINTRVENYNPENGIINHVHDALNTTALESAVMSADMSRGGGERNLRREP
jgi:hypothetical protein